MKQRGDQTEIMLPRPCVITPAFNYVDIWQGRALIPKKFTKAYQTSVSHPNTHKYFLTAGKSENHTHKVMSALLYSNN